MGNLVSRLAAAGAIVAAIAAQQAAATVRYDFTAISSYPPLGDSESYSGSFTYVAPTFVVAPATIPTEALASCSVVSSIGNPAACAPMAFMNFFLPFGVNIGFGIASPNYNGQLFYYFDPVSFTTAGTYDNILNGGGQLGRLVVTDLGGAVPEPASWALMIAGFGVVGAALRRRRMGAIAA